MINYFVKKEDKEYGPFTLKQLKHLPINANTLVWYAGQEEWSQAANHYELRELFKAKLPFTAFAKSKLIKLLRRKISSYPLKRVS